MAAAAMLIFIPAVFAGCVQVKRLIDKESFQEYEQYGGKIEDKTDGSEKNIGSDDADGIKNADEDSKTGKERSVRLQEYDFVNRSSVFATGDYIDVRIAFPNGIDCMVLGCKKIEGGSDNTTILCVSEDEILRMASAKTDVNRYAGCVVYAVGYAGGKGEEGICNYPVNREVYKAYGWNPNTAEKSEADGTLKYAVKRAELEKGLEAYLISE